MKILEQILEGVAKPEEGVPNLNVYGITDDSREVKSGYVFIATKGINSDGRDYIPQAIEAGACCIIYEGNLNREGPEEMVWIEVENAVLAKAKIASNFYDDPSSNIKLIGITGTNGKTTVASLIFDLIRAYGAKCGLISTIDYRINDQTYDTTHTTPGVIKLNQILSTMLEEACEFAVMEVSSHAVDQKRIEGLNFDLALFTNLSHDHLGYHGTYKNYINAKKTFFDELEKSAIAIVNTDDKNAAVMLQNSKAKNLTYGLRKFADYKAKILSNTIAGLEMQIDNHHVHFKLVGEFNAYNLLAVYAAARQYFDDEVNVLRIMSALQAAEGRFERIENKGKKITGIIDYAHTPDALENVLKTIFELKEPGSKIITVVGCGGDRDKLKRPKMAEIAEKYSDKLILTSDNPRSEDPAKIIEEMKVGIKDLRGKQTIDVLDRKKAIEMANMMAEQNDIILIAGKGHEKYQIIKG